MNTNEEQIEAVELSMEQAKSSISKMNALQRLTNNKDFIEIVTEGYFEKEASRIVIMKAEPAMADVPSQQQLMKMIDSIGSLRQYFIAISRAGQMAVRALEDDQKTHEELLEEGV